MGKLSLTVKVRVTAVEPGIEGGPDTEVAVVAQAGGTIDFTVDAPGAYRVEVRQTPEHLRAALGSLADLLLPLLALGGGQLQQRQPRSRRRRSLLRGQACRSLSLLLYSLYRRRDTRDRGIHPHGRRGRRHAGSDASPTATCARRTRSSGAAVAAHWTMSELAHAASDRSEGSHTTSRSSSMATPASAESTGSSGAVFCVIVML